MVKYGQCYIQCKVCGHGCGVDTQIQRNGGWEYNVVSQRCRHWIMAIHMKTNDSYVPWGDADEIRFRVEWTSVNNRYRTGFYQSGKKSTNDGKCSYKSKSSSGCKVKMQWSGNTIGDIMGNIAIGVAGFGVTGALIEPLIDRGDYLTTLKM